MFMVAVAISAVVVALLAGIWYAVNARRSSDLDEFTFEQLTPEIFSAISCGDSARLEDVLCALRRYKDESGAPRFDLNKPRRGGGYLTFAARMDDIDSQLVLLKHGADLEQADSNGETALHVCARNGKMASMQLLLERGANVNVKARSQYTPLHWCAINGRVEGLELLLAFGADVGVRSSAGRTPLHCAASNGHTRIVELLLKAGSDVNSQDVAGDSPLHLNAKNGSASVVKLLLAHGADFRMRNHKQSSPFTLAAIQGYLPFLELLAVQDPEFHLLELETCLMTVPCPSSPQCTGIVDTIVKNLTKVILGMHKVDACRVLQERLGSDLQAQALALLHRDGCEQLSPLERCTNQSGETSQPVWLSRSQSLGGSSIDCMCVKDDTEDQVKQQPRLEDVLQCHLRGPPRDMFLHAARFYGAVSKHVVELSGETEADAVDQSAETAISLLSTTWSALSGRLERLCTDLATVCNGDISESSTAVESSGGQTPKSEKLSEALLDIAAVVQSHYMVCESVDRERVFVKFLHGHKASIRLLLSMCGGVIFTYFDFLLENFARPDWSFQDIVGSLDFERKREWFRKRLRELRALHNDETCVVTVDRHNLMSTSCLRLMDGLMGSLNVQFAEEPGSGAGVRREWFQLIAREMFNPDNALFAPCADATFQPNPASGINPDHLSFFAFVGKVIGLAIYHEELMEVFFTRSFYKHVLSIPVDFEDLQSIDLQYYRSLESIRECEDVEELDLNFTATSREFGETKIIELIEGGKDIAVTNENKGKYLQLLTEQRMTNAILEQISAFKSGLYSILPRRLLHLFNEYELELLIAGMPTIDFDDWEEHTRYIGFEKDDEMIRMFWSILRSLPQDEATQLLQFATGCARVPLGGFANLKGMEGRQPFTIALNPQGNDAFPSASTCFNLLKLPRYDNEEVARDKIRLALRCREGFQMA